MSSWCLQFLPENERKQVYLRYHSSKNEFIRSFFGRIHGLTICFRVLLTFSCYIGLTLLVIHSLVTLSTYIFCLKFFSTKNQLNLKSDRQKKKYSSIFFFEELGIWRQNTNSLMTFQIFRRKSKQTEKTVELFRYVQLIISFRHSFFSIFVLTYILFLKSF